MDNPSANESVEPVEPAPEQESQLPESKLHAALKSERESRKALEKQVKELSGKISELEPFKNRWDGVEKEREVSGMVKALEKSEGGPWVHQPDKFNEILTMVDKDDSLSLQDKVSRAFELSRIHAKETFKTPAPFKSSDGIIDAPDSFAKQFKSLPFGYARPK